MRSRHLIFSALMLASILLCGCDQIRMMFGKPTSEDIRDKKLRIEAAEANRAAKTADSLARATEEEQARLKNMTMAEEILQPDSSDAFASLKDSGCRINRKSSVSFNIVSELPARYSIIVGAFSSKANADNLGAELAKAGCSVFQITYQSGLTAVAADSSDNIIEISEKYLTLREKEIIPKDAWILVNE